METIQIEVSPELAQRLRPSPEELTLQKQISVVLHQIGAYGADLETVRQYLGSHENQDWMPIQTNGKPASEMIVEERASRSWSSW
jgi:hypothetical protein